MTTCVALVDLPALLADVVRDALGEEAEIEIQVLPDGSAPEEILRHVPDIVVVGMADPEHFPDSEFLLRRRPALALFAITPDARRAWIHELTPTARRVAKLSGSSLREAVREAASRASILRDQS